MNQMETQGTMRSRGVTDGLAGVDRCLDHVTELVGPELSISIELRERWSLDEGAVRAMIVAASTELRLRVQTYGSPALRPPVLAMGIAAATVFDWLGILPVVRDAGVPEQGRAVLGILLVILLITLTGGGWHAFAKVIRREANSSKGLATALAMVWLALVGSISTIRYLQVASTGLPLIGRAALVGIFVAASVGPAVAAAWAYWEYQRQFPTWKRIRELRAEIDRHQNDLDRLRAEWNEKEDEVKARADGRRQAEASYRIGYYQGIEARHRQGQEQPTEASATKGAET